MYVKRMATIFVATTPRSVPPSQSLFAFFQPSLADPLFITHIFLNDKQLVCTNVTIICITNCNSRPIWCASSGKLRRPFSSLKASLPTFFFFLFPLFPFSSSSSFLSHIHSVCTLWRAWLILGLAPRGVNSREVTTDTFLSSPPPFH